MTKTARVAKPVRSVRGRRGFVFWFGALLLAVIASRRALSRYEVAGTSMSPALTPGDWLVCESATLRIRSPRRGEIVIFDSPVTPGLDVVKRVLAVGGDDVSLGSGLDALGGGGGGGGDTQGSTQGSAQSSGQTEGGGGNGSSVRPPTTITVDEDEIFVVGDNLSASTDSRDFGAISISSVRSVARIRYRSGATRRPTLGLIAGGETA